jgi:coproporphyrinogen III oxidase
LCAASAGLEAVDGHAKFQEDLWERLEGGVGRYRKWAVFEKVGKCFTVHMSTNHAEIFNGEADFLHAGLRV